MEDDGRDLWVDMNSALRRVRALSPIRSARSNLKEAAKSYNTLRNRLRQLKRQCMADAMVEFRAKYRGEFRAIQQRYVAASANVRDLERGAVIFEEGPFMYAQANWRHIHETMGTGVQIKDDNNGRRTEPWNSSFWYA